MGLFGIYGLQAVDLAIKNFNIIIQHKSLLGSPLKINENTNKPINTHRVLIGNIPVLVVSSSFSVGRR